MDKLIILIRQKLRNVGMWDEFVRVFNVLHPECDPETTVLSAGDMYIVLGALDSEEFLFDDVLWALICQERHNDIADRMAGICAQLQRMIVLPVSDVCVPDEPDDTAQVSCVQSIDQTIDSRTEAERLYSGILETHTDALVGWILDNPGGSHREYFAAKGLFYCLQRRSEAGHPIPANDRAHIYAARAGHVNVIKWLIDNEQPNLLEICEAAAPADQRDVLDYMLDNHCFHTHELIAITKSAAAVGNSLMTQYLLVHHISPCEEIAVVAPPELATWIRSMIQ